MKNSLYSLSYNKKINFIKEGKYLDVFINDEDWRVRRAVGRTRILRLILNK